MSRCQALIIRSNSTRSVSFDLMIRAWQLNVIWPFGSSYCMIIYIYTIYNNKVWYQWNIKQLNVGNRFFFCNCTIYFSKILSKKFTFILQEFHFLENKDTADIMNFHIKTILFFIKRPWIYLDHFIWMLFLNDGKKDLMIKIYLLYFWKWHCMKQG